MNGIARVVLAAALTGSLLAAQRTIEQQGVGVRARGGSHRGKRPRYATWVRSQPPDASGPVQRAAEQLRARTEALYVVVTDTAGRRYAIRIPP